jgi:hypothetical protein
MAYAPPRPPHPARADNDSLESLRKEIYGSPTIETLKSWKRRWYLYSFSTRLLTYFIVLMLMLLGGIIVLSLKFGKREHKVVSKAAAAQPARVFQWCCDGVLEVPSKRKPVI